MLDRLLYFLFRSKVGMLILFAGVICGAFTLGGCFSWSVLSCVCGKAGCDTCADLFDDCDKQFSCDTGCDFLDCAFGNGFTKDCGDCGVMTCGGCNASCFTECGVGGGGSCVGCGGGYDDYTCQFSNCTCTDQKSAYSTYSLTVNLALYDANGDYIETVTYTYDYKAERLENIPDSQKVAFPSSWNDYFGTVIKVLDGDDREVGFENDELTISFEDWKDGNHSDYTVSFKVFAAEKRTNESVLITIDYSAVGLPAETYSATVGSMTPNIVAKEVAGYTFNAFVMQDGRSISFDPDKIFHLIHFGVDPAAEQLELYIEARYDAAQCGITVERVENGSVTATIYDETTDYGQALSLIYREINGSALEADPDEDTRFLGWFYDSALTQPVDWERDKLTSDTSIYCAYRTQVTVTLYNYNAPGDGAETIVAWWGELLGTDIVLPDTRPANGRFTFEGWFTDADCTQAVGSETRVTGDTALYAKWNEKTKYTVTYYADMGGTVTNITDTYDYYTGLILRDSETVLAPEGYAFEGWRLEEEDGGFSAPMTQLSAKMYERDMRVYAAFSRTMQLIVLNGSLGSSDSVKLYYKEGKSLPVPRSNDPTKEFAGWATDSGGTNMVSDDEGQVTSFEYTGNSPALIAIWKARTYTVTFYYQDGGRIVVVDEQEIVYGGYAKAPSETPQKKGYTFVRWVKEFTDIPFSEETPVTEDVEYAAEFEALEYKITLKVDGQEDRVITVRYGTKPRLEVPQSTGVFMGWYTQPGGNGERKTDSNGIWLDAFYDTADDITLYAYFI